VVRIDICIDSDNVMSKYLTPSNFTFLASNFSLWKKNKNTFPGFVCVPFFLCRCSGLGRVTTNAISWSVRFIVFQRQTNFRVRISSWIFELGFRVGFSS